MSLRTLVMAAAALSVASLLGGCAYDYWQHTDRVGYSAGDAVAHNLAQETVNPSKRSMYVKSGLGRNGNLAGGSDGSSASSSSGG